MRRRRLAARSTSFASRLAASVFALAFLLVGWAAGAHVAVHAAGVACGHDDREVVPPPAQASCHDACDGHAPSSVGSDAGPGRPSAPCDVDDDGHDCSLCRVLGAPGVPLALPAPLPLPVELLLRRVPTRAALASAPVLRLGLARGPPAGARR